jgi:hypothetical protein
MVGITTLTLLSALLLQGTVQAGPEIRVFDGLAPPGSKGVHDNFGLVLYGSTPVGVAKAKTFTVKNTGNADLLLKEPIKVPAGFTLMQSFGTTKVAPGKTTTFVIALNSATAGSFAGQVSFGTNDSNENPFNFFVAGVSEAPPSLRIVDNGDPGFNVVGKWQRHTGGGFQQDYHHIAAGTGQNSATWTFTGLATGQYRVFATWAASSTAAPDAVYTIQDNGSNVGIAQVNQQLAPAGFFDAGQNWTELGGPYTIQSGTLKVTLTDKATGAPIADAIRIERVGYPGAILDNGAGFATSGHWHASKNGFQGSSYYAHQGNGVDAATWTFSNLVPGQYQVRVTWPGSGGNLAHAAHYEIIDNGKTIATTHVNQRGGVHGLRDAGAVWRNLGIFSISGPTLVVRLTDQHGHRVVADAVRIERVNFPTIESYADTVRFLEQATWGPTEELIAYVRARGFRAFLEEQFAAPSSGYPSLPLKPTNNNVGCPADPKDPSVRTICLRDHYSHYLLQNRFFVNGLYGTDQLRQRVTFALHEIFVVSGRDIPQPSWLAPYLQILDGNAFGNYRTLLKGITLNPAMGNYLDMAGSTKKMPNENYAREVLQLFSIGLYELNPDGSQILDASGKPIPTYDQAIIDNFAKVFTGWNFAPAPAAGVPNYIAPMVPNDNNHDKTAHPLLRGVTLPANQTAVKDLEDALDNIFYHPNVGPFIGKRLIQHLVTSTPSPAYIARVTAVFNDNGQGVRGDLRAVVRAILLDPEARGDFKTNPNYGRLRHPPQYLLGVLRMFNALSADRTKPSDGVLNGQSVAMGLDVWRPPSVFSDFQPELQVRPGVFGPEFTTLTTVTTLKRADFINLFVYSKINPGNNVPNGTSIDLTKWEALAANPPALVEALNQLLLHGTMSQAMRDNILQAVNTVPATNPRRRAQNAIYLILTSSQYQIQR